MTEPERIPAYMSILSRGKETDELRMFLSAAERDADARRAVEQEGYHVQIINGTGVLTDDGQVADFRDSAPGVYVNAVDLRGATKSGCETR